MPPETTEKPETSMTSGNAAAGMSGGAGDSRDGGRDDGSRPDPGKPRPEFSAPRPAPAGAGFFTIYKKGQGYWTRMGTAAGALLLGALTAYQIYHVLPILLTLEPDSAVLRTMSPTEAAAAVTRAVTLERNIAIGSAIAFLLLFAFAAWRMMNKASNVDFLIATDSEMKKVNWTSRKDLIGSTKVVIVFMFLIALILFLIDIIFSYFFYLIGVLKHSPFGGGGTIGGG